MKIYSPHILGSFGQSGSLAYFDGNVGIGTTSPSAKLDVSGSAIITGSLNVTQGITGSLLGTASYATQALSSSFATTASYYGGSVTSASFASTASNITPVISNDADTRLVTANGNGTLSGEGNLQFDGNTLKVLYQAGDEGGEILMAKPVTNTTIAGTGVTVDIYQNKLRFFEQGGSARGYYLDITAGGAGVATNLASGGGTVTSVGTTGTVNGITLTGGPITGAGTITLGGTLSGIGNAQLTNSSVTIGSTNIALGATSTTLAGLTSVTATNFTGTASYATQATSASYARTASYVQNAVTASYVLNAVSSSYALSASYARTASYVQNAVSASYVLNSVSSSYALTASYALNGGSGNPFPYSGSAEITGSLVVNDGLANLIDTVGYTLGDTNSVVSVGWGDRRLVHSGGGVAIYWDTPNQQQSVEVSRAYLKSTPDINAQENFSAGEFNAEGRILQGVSFNGASDYDFVYLDNSAGEWRPVDNVSSRASKMLGIAFGIGSTDSVLLEGHVTITDSPGTYPIPAVDTIAHGLPIYVSSSAFATTTTPTTTGEYVRILGHAYYQNTGDPDVWVMNFRPDHTWVEL